MDITEKNTVSSKAAADTLFEYLRRVIYEPSKAALDPGKLPGDFQALGEGLEYFGNCIIEMTTLAKELARGNLNCAMPPSDNEMAAPLKMLHASLRHLTWQAQQVASGDYKQRVDFMGEFSAAFNNMIAQLGQRWQVSLEEKSKLQRYVNLMLANCPDPILLFDRDCRIVYVSDSYIKHCAFCDIGAVLGKHLRELFAPVVPEDFLSELENMFKISAEELRTTEAAQVIDFAGNGSYRHFQLQLTPMPDESGRVEGMMMFLRDTTEAEWARREAEKALELAERSSRAKSEFLARMSHEMRTPMNAIVGMTAIYNASGDPQRKDYCVGKISEASKHLSGVITDVLDMANIEADKFGLSYGEVDFRKTVEAAIGTIRFNSERRKQRLTFQIDPSIPQIIITDGRRLGQVINNLLSNAVKFTPDGGEISLTASSASAGGTIVVTVKDSGIGISKEQQKQLFVPFEQIDGGVARRFGGTGLGLSISKYIIDKLGGKIRVESGQGNGSAFIFEIPARPAEGTRPSADFGGSGDARPDSDDGIFSGVNVLVAEDVELNREILISLLELTGIEADYAEDGAEAFEKFAVSPDKYALIIMDINMPNMDGYEAARRIRGSGLLGADKIPIIALTANVFQEDIEKCLAAGMNGHLAKPIDPGELISQLKKYI